MIFLKDLVILTFETLLNDGWDGQIVIFCWIPDSVNWCLISGRFWIRILLVM